MRKVVPCLRALGALARYKGEFEFAKRLDLAADTALMLLGEIRASLANPLRRWNGSQHSGQNCGRTTFTISPKNFSLLVLVRACIRA